MSNPVVTNVHDEKGRLVFTLSNVDVSYANAIRRTILSDIPTVVIRTIPYSQNTCNVTKNTAKLHNEIVKQRLSCIPIHISDLSDENISKYQLELDETNSSNTVRIVTSEHFKIKNKETGKYLSDKHVHEIFPPFVPDGTLDKYYIELTRLEPCLTPNSPGESIKLYCSFNIGTAKENGSFNVVGTCAYGCTPDKSRIASELNARKAEWKSGGMTESELETESLNWALLEGKRITVQNSFDFVIESVGVYTNIEIVAKACDILSQKLKQIDDRVQSNDSSIVIEPINTKLENGYDVYIDGEDYSTIRIISHMLYVMYFQGTKQLTYCGSHKAHPHHTNIVIRLAFTDSTDGNAAILDMFNKSITSAIATLNHIKTNINV